MCLPRNMHRHSRLLQGSLSSPQRSSPLKARYPTLLVAPDRFVPLGCTCDVPTRCADKNITATLHHTYHGIPRARTMFNALNRFISRLDGEPMPATKENHGAF